MIISRKKSEKNLQEIIDIALREEIIKILTVYDMHGENLSFMQMRDVIRGAVIEYDIDDEIFRLNNLLSECLKSSVKQQKEINALKDGLDKGEGPGDVVATGKYDYEFWSFKDQRDYYKSKCKELQKEIDTRDFEDGMQMATKKSGGLGTWDELNRTTYNFSGGD